MSAKCDNFFLPRCSHVPVFVFKLKTLKHISNTNKTQVAEHLHKHYNNYVKKTNIIDQITNPCDSALDYNHH
jgi:hypothetical protein